MTKTGVNTHTFNKPTGDEKQEREYALSEILIKFKEESKAYQDKDLLSEMRKQGYKEYDRFKLYTDKKALAQKNTFIRDLTEANVSKFYEDIYGNLDRLSKDALEEYNKLQESKTSSGKEKRAIGYYMMHLAERQDEMMKGPMMNISNALATRKIAKLSEDSEKLKNLLIKNGIDPETGLKKRYASDVTTPKAETLA